MVETLIFSFKGGFYEIRVQGQLDINLADWIEGLLVTTEGNGETVLSGFIVDQAALHSVLSKLYCLNLPLLSVKSDEQTRVIADLEI